MQEFGFKTFNGFIDESYDHEKDAKKRTQLIFQELDKFQKKSNEELKDWWKDILPILDYNQRRFLEFGKGKTKKYTDSLYWAYLSKLGNISEADDLVSELIDLIPEKTVETIREEVKIYLENSIESGSETSIMQLGKFFLDIVEEKEYPSAYKWFTVGAALGLESAVEMRDEVEEELTPEEIIEEQDNADKFFNNFVSKRSQNSKGENNS